jgi:hypothetical protein
MQLDFSSNVATFVTLWQTVLLKSSGQTFGADCTMTVAQTFNRVTDKKSNSLLIYLIKGVVMYTEKMASIKTNEGEKMIIKI